MRQSSGFHSNNNNNNNRFNGGTSGILTAQHNQRQQHNNEQLQLQLNAAWQPLTHHNNWLILQATAASSVQRQTIEEQKEQEQKLDVGNHVEQQGGQGQGLPGNYYAYNHRYQNQNASQVSPPSPIVRDGGNYKQVRRATLSDPPTGSYVLAISQSMRRGQLRRQLPMATPLLQPTQSVSEDVEAYAARGKPEVRDRALTLTNAAFSHADDAYAGGGAAAADTDDVDGDGDGPDISDKSSDMDIDAYLGPFERALVKVSNFCDTVRALISDEDERRPSKLDATAAVAATSKEVQGRYFRLASQEEEEDDEEEGRKLKKLKKKIQKLLLPLLIAYKLKFLTLIPVLIGGLTLLVGTTGLAGFFFALFTAVMSLKTATGGGHGSKALLLKKI
ncbi:uncharacterized protein LOC111519508 [Drosophila willistoni]|uniref:uncharacterized protein LOC111519508 n=1 Tax=Drosophila willistoni TaxID=7260 RepID=UPI001F08146F|nr:uncharacterized protein LOC111519508 [Drosophila willistoni]